jgi:hypothetical protein
MSEAGRCDRERLAWARRYEEALDHYLARRWSEALEIVAELRRRTPDDLSVKFLEEKVRECAAEEPGEDWRGVFWIESK